MQRVDNEPARKGNITIEAGDAIMSLGGAMNSGVSGLQSFSTSMGVIGNNLANTNTAGFKASRSLFSDLIPDNVSGSGGVSQVGRGSNLSVVDDIFSQGSIESTASNLDLAIEGDGFFMVRNPDSQASNFTRAGAFRLDQDGFLINPEGHIVQGYERLPGGQFADLTGDIRINTRSSVPGEASSQVDLTTNLDANSRVLNTGGITATATVEFQDPDEVETIEIDGVGVSVDGDMTAADVAEAFLALDYDNWTVERDPDHDDMLVFTSLTPDSEVESLSVVGNSAGISEYTSGSEPAFRIDDPVNTSNFATTSEIYDSLGQTHLVTTYFRKTDQNEWEYYHTVPGADLQEEDPEEIVEVGRGSLEFDESGILTEITPDGGSSVDDESREWPVVTTIDEGALNWNNGSETGNSLDYKMNLTQFSTESRVVTQQSDGYASGYLTDITVDQEGIITGTYSNGESRELSRLALGKFANDNGLEKIGNNLYGATRASGPADIGIPGAGFGRIFSNSLEQSTVDIAEEFTKMITTQRSFQANSKTITSTDEMLQEVINMKR